MTPRRVYLDCEFLPADQSTRGLVSIGLTDDQGRDYYAVNADMDVAAVLAVPWMVANVWQYLPRIVIGGDEPGRLLNTDHPDVKHIAQIREEVAAYFAGHAETHLYAYYGGQDICRLHSLWDNNWGVMPLQIPRWFVELEWLVYQAGNPRMPEQVDGEHHALADARYNREMHEHLLSLAACPCGGVGVHQVGCEASR